MKVFLLTLFLLIASVVGMAVTILVKPEGRFPDGEISHNKELRKKGIICAKEEELRMWKNRKHTPKEQECNLEECRDCKGCESYRS